MTLDDFIEGVFASEGVVYGDRHTVPAIDQPTGAGGVTLQTLRAYVAATGSPLPVNVDTLQHLTKVTAAPIVRWKIETDITQYQFDAITFDPLRYQMLDFAYNSGPGTAIRWLQRVLRVPRSSKMDAATLEALRHNDLWLVNLGLVAARLQMIDMWTDSDKQAKAWEEGVESRGLRFSLLEVP
jgi:lysozyme family protein